MSGLSPFIYGPLQVVWNPDYTINRITYQSLPLIDAVNQRVNPLSLQSGWIILTPDLHKLIEDMLNAVASLPQNDKKKKIFLADKIFEHLVISFNPPNPKLQSQFWSAIMRIIWAWEDAHEKVHKGTAYYFMAESYLALGDVPSAYMCFFNALEDDKRNFPSIPKNLKDAGAYLTTSLVDDQRNALYQDVVIPLRTYLQGFIDKYNNCTKHNLKLQTLDQKFLQVDPLEDIKRFFVASFHEIYHLAPLNSTRMINNDYSKLKVIDTLFNLGLVIDQILEYKFLQSAPKKDMGKAIYNLALQQGWTTSKDTKNPGEFPIKVNSNPNVGSPDQVLPPLLDGTATYDGISIKNNIIMRSIILAYHIRNFGGHHLEGSTILVTRYQDVLEMIMDAFFISVEIL